jgi:hydroxymethylbilane synthase
VPIGARAILSGTTVHLTGLIASVDGRRIIKDTITGPMEQAALLGTTLAETLLARGGKAILDAVYAADASGTE